MAQKILLADDSMTAQNMGKKILVEAGYEIVAVSNGAAAIKKIAEVRPELVILDVYMPGYSGVEVCERLRGALDTAHLPVLLTVGKLEPFKPEEGNRVKADGLLIKPFEATDLLATVKKLLEKRGAAAERAAVVPPQAPITGFSDASYEEWKTETVPEEEKTQKIEVPQEMAVTPAMGDVLETYPVQPPAEAPKPAFEMTKAAAAAAIASMPPAFHVEPLAPECTAAPTPVFDVDFQLDEPTVAAPAEPLAPEAPEPAPFGEEFTPQSPAIAPDPLLEAILPEMDFADMGTAVLPAPAEEVEFTATPQAPDVVAEPLADLEPTILQDAIPVEMATDAALVTSPEELAQFTTKFGVEHPEDIPVGDVSALPPETAAALVGPEPFVMPEEPAAVVEPEPLVMPEQSAAVVEPEPVVMPEEPAAVSAPEPVVMPEEPAPAIGVEPFVAPEELMSEPEPPRVVEDAAAAVAPEAVEELAGEAAPSVSLVEEMQRAFADVPAEPAVAESESTSEAPQAAAPDAAMDEAAVAKIVERVIGRLTPELVAAIVKELKG